MSKRIGITVIVSCVPSTLITELEKSSVLKITELNCGIKEELVKIRKIFVRIWIDSYWSVSKCAKYLMRLAMIYQP